MKELYDKINEKKFALYQIIKVQNKTKDLYYKVEEEEKLLKELKELNDIFIRRLNEKE